MTIIFEDNADVPSSRLLSRGVPGSLVFSESSSRICKKVRGVVKNNKDEHILVFVDLVPDNDRVVQEYNRIVEYCSINQNIIVVPIVCIEYYLAKLLIKLRVCENCKELKLAVDTVESKKSWYSIMGSEFRSCISLEKVFKKFFCENSKYLDRYYWNITKNRSGFYDYDDTVSVIEKSQVFWCLLPFMPIGIAENLKQKYSLQIRNFTWDEVRSYSKHFIDQFIQLFSAYNKFDYFIHL